MQIKPPIYIMLIDRKIVTYTRTYKKECTREIEFDALFIKGITNEDWQALKVDTPKAIDKPQRKGIDKITFTIPLDYINEEDYSTQRIKRGAYTFSRTATALKLNLHGEYIPHTTSLLEYTNSIFKYLVYCTELFKLPLTKVTTDLKTGEIKEKQFKENENTTIDTFLDKVLAKVTLSIIELHFDFLEDITKYLNTKEFILCDSTLYSRKDYRIYTNNVKKHSILCIYDKRKQLEQVKQSKCQCSELWRFELRISKDSFTALKHTTKVLANTYNSLVVYLTKSIRKHTKYTKLGICFNKLKEHLPNEFYELKILL